MLRLSAVRFHNQHMRELYAKLPPIPYLCFVIGQQDRYARFAISSSLKTCAPHLYLRTGTNPRHAQKPQHRRRRRGEDQQEGYVMEIPCLVGAPLMRMFRSNFLKSAPANISKSGANALAMMIQDGSLPVRLNQSMPAMIAMAVE
jgi:hypothetical protein